MKFDKERLFWVHEPESYKIGDDRIVITTAPETDFWRRTYYGFCHDNAPALLIKTDERYFSFGVRTDFNFSKRFDQCGIMIYQNEENSVKVGVEYHNEREQWLGSVVTNNGFSDWATAIIPPQQDHMYLRVSRRESDFLIENSADGVNYNQMRITHLCEGSGEINIGLFACSAEDGSFDAVFTEFGFTDCKWEAHK